MAKLPPGQFLLPPRGGALRGVFYTTVNGEKLTLRAWPKKRPRAATAKEAEARLQLAAMANCTLYMDAHQQEFSAELARRTTLNPRDLLTMAMFNRIGTIVLTTGRKLYSVASIQDVSLLLDAIGQVEGDLLVRGEGFWNRIPIGEIGQVLTIDAAGELAWIDSQGGTGGNAPWVATTGANVPSIATTAAATLGLPLWPTESIQLYKLRVGVSPTVAGHVFRAAVYLVNAAHVIQSIVQTIDVPAPLVGYQLLEFVFPLPAVMTAGNRYIIGITDTNAATVGTNPRVYSWVASNCTHPYFSTLPAEPLLGASQHFYSMANRGPIVGNTFTEGSEAGVSMQLKVSYVG